MSGQRGDQRVPPKKKPLSHGWIVVTSKTYPDRVYFYNTVTKCSTWNNPCESTSDREYNSNSSDSSSSVTRKSAIPSSKRERRSLLFHSPDKNRNICINNEIEDYDEEQDQYFNNVPLSSHSLSHFTTVSPSSSPESDSSGNISDSEKHSGSILLENNKKQLWVHFVSKPEKTKAKKSVALCDLDEPSTSRNMDMEPSNERGKKKEKLSLRESGTSFCNTDSFNKDSDRGINGFTRKKCSKRPESSKKSVTEKGLKKFSFKRSDKTPAQTRLLKLRKQNAERLKELASNFPDFVIPKSNGVEGKKDKNLNNFEVDRQPTNDSFSEAYLKRIEILSNNQDGGVHSEVDFVEEMDWEPSNVESDVKNINVLRQQLSKTSEISSEVFFGLSSDHLLNLPPKNSLILVLDTNIFVSCLDFVKELRDAKICDLGYPVIYVPWRALQELDHLKDTKIDTVERHIHANVRRAIAYLNENFKSRHPRVFGQSFEDFAKMVDVETFAPDDEILQTCIHFQKQNPDKKLMLLTNDKNLESKAIVSGVEAYSKDRFMKKYLNSQLDSTSAKTTSNPPSNEGARLDDCLCEVKVILKDFIPAFVETEMRIAFEGDWIKLSFKKPPWTLQDALDTLLKHWRSVFFLIFPRETHSEAEKLYERLFKREPASTEDVEEIIKTIQRLLISIKKHQKKKRAYVDLIPPLITKLCNLLRTITPSHSSQDDTSVSTSSCLPPNDSSESRQTPEESPEIFKVKTLFKDLWDSLRSFCCSISDVIHSSGANNFAVVQEIRLKVTQILNEIGELVVTVEKILEMNVRDINESHPLIVYFSNFLIRVYPVMAPDLKGELPMCLAAFFTDFEGRCLIRSSLNDFREFIQDLRKATEYFNTQLPC